MDQEYYDALAKVRLDRAKELLAESAELLEKEADDFYVASKEETKQQVENAGKIVEKVSKYIEYLQN